VTVPSAVSAARGAARLGAPTHDSASALQPQETILSLFGEYVDGTSLVWSGGLVQALNLLGFGASASRVALHRVLSRGLLVRVRRGRLVYYQGSERLAPLLEEGRRHLYGFGHERTDDGQWTFVWYSIPEELRMERRRLGRRLSFLGFGSLQDGTWIAQGDRSPDVSVLARQLRVEAHTAVLVGHLADVVQPHELVARAWDLPRFRRECRVFLDRFLPLWRDAVGDLNDQDAFTLRTYVIDAYRQIVEMVPPRVAGIETEDQVRATALFGDMQSHLAAPAKAYFSSLVEPYS
jgi:phenylacetic acid degradation operon negative regulatory protein